MHSAEQLLTDIVSAVAVATATVCKEIESHQKSKNFRSASAANSVQTILQTILANASNKGTVEDIYAIFIAHLRGNPEGAPAIRISRPNP